MAKEEKEKKKERVMLINSKLLKEICKEIITPLEKYELSNDELVYVFTFLYEGIMDLDADVRRQSVMTAKLSLIQKKMMEELKRKDL